MTDGLARTLRRIGQGVAGLVLGAGLVMAGFALHGSIPGLVGRSPVVWAEAVSSGGGEGGSSGGGVCTPDGTLTQVFVGCVSNGVGEFEWVNSCGSVMSTHDGTATRCDTTSTSSGTSGSGGDSTGGSSGSQTTSGGGSGSTAQTGSNSSGSSDPCPTGSNGQPLSSDPSYCENANWSCTGTAGTCINGEETTTYPAGCTPTSEVFTCGSGATACQGKSIGLYCTGCDEAMFEPTNSCTGAANGADYIGYAGGCTADCTSTTTTTTTTTTTGTPTTTSTTPPPAEPTGTPITGTTITAPTTSSSCPAGQELESVTSYTAEQQCTPTYSSEPYTYTVEVPETEYVTEEIPETETTYVTQNVTESYACTIPETETVTETVPYSCTVSRTVCYETETHRRICRTEHEPSTCYRTENVTETVEVPSTCTETVQETVPETQTIYVQETVPETVYVSEEETGYETVQTGESCQTVEVPSTTEQCEPVTITQQVTSVGVPTFDICMPNPELTSINGQKINPPTNDQWVTQGGAPPNTLLPGPGWAIDSTGLQLVTTTCVGTGANQSCQEQTSPMGSGYQEVYDPNNCPYPVVQFSPNPTVTN